MKQKIFHLPHYRILLFLLVLILLTGCARSTPPAPTLTHVPSIPTVVINTMTPTASPTISPTATATIEPIWTPQPTNTPLVPPPAAGQSYRLTTWTPEKAGQLIEELKAYPETLPWGSFMGLKYAAYQYAGITEMESALRFPQSDQAKTWQWDGAYNLYLSNNADIGSLYGTLIARALNQKETDLQKLPSWFTKTTHFNLDAYPVKPPKGYERSLVLHIHFQENDSFFSSGFAVWLLQKEGEYLTYPLKNAIEIAYHEGVSHLDTVDLTGDGTAEVMIQNVDWQSFNVHNGSLVIYRLDQVPPQKIEFDTPLFDDATTDWSVTSGSPAPMITFQMPVSVESDSPCTPVTTGWQYRWQEGKLKFIQYVPPAGEAKTEMEQRPFCARVLANILANTRYLENGTVLAAYKQMLDLPYISKDFPEFEPPFYVEMRRFDLALFLSSQGDEAGAAEQIQLIQASSIDPALAEWRKDALAYFAIHRNPQALLQFCLTSKKCGTFLGLADVVALIPPSRFSEAGVVLQQMGISFDASGNYDFDQDGKVEKWLLVLSPNPCAVSNEFWILANPENGIKSRRAAANLCLDEEENGGWEVAINPLAPSGGLTAYQVTLNGKEILSKPFLYWPLDQKDPIIDTSSNNQMIDTLQNKLLLKQISPVEAQAQLEAIQNLPLEPSYFTDEFQAKMLYLLGLIQEMNGAKGDAAQTYLTLWQTYPDSPYAMIAFAKLEPVP